MEIALLVVLLAAAVTALNTLAGRFSISAPLLLVLVGIAASFVPGLPEIELLPEVVLLGLLPPLLYSAAIRTSLVDFQRNRRPIGLLSVGLVVFTTLGIGLLTKTLLPEVPLAAALALGAVVAPPDAVAAMAIARRVGMPRRVVTILEGESLVNDATALVCLRLAIVAIGGSVSATEIAFDFALSAGGGLTIGLVTGWLVSWLRSRVTNPVTDGVVSLLTPWLAYLPAEEVHASGVLAVVVAGLLLGHRSPVIQQAASRIFERTIWSAVQFLLEGLVFLLIGLQLRRLLEDLNSSDVGLARTVLVGLALIVAVLVLRIVWVFPCDVRAAAYPERSAGRPQPALAGDDAGQLGCDAWGGDPGRGVPAACEDPRTRGAGADRVHRHGGDAAHQRHHAAVPRALARSVRARPGRGPPAGGRRAAAGLDAGDAGAGRGAHR